MTDTLPLFPAAPGAERLETKPLSVRVNVPAVTSTLPALPLPEVNEPIPASTEVWAPLLIVTGPTVVTDTFPAFPVPLATVPREEPESTVAEPPTETVIPPPVPAAPPPLQVAAAVAAQDPASTFAPLCKASSPATIEIAPPGPAFEAVADARLDTVLASTRIMPAGAVAMVTPAPLPLLLAKACTMALLLSVT